MWSSSVLRSLAITVSLLIATPACRRERADAPEGGAAARTAVEAPAPARTASGGAAVDPRPETAGAASPAGAFAFTEADLEGYERGLAREIELVREAKERERTATTPEERARASQAQWEDQTAPEGARTSGLSLERYRETRRTVNRVLETLDFQGKIDGPMEMNVELASAEMRARLTNDPFAELAPASAAALKARMDRLVPVWVEYVRLTAVAG